MRALITPLTEDGLIAAIAATVGSAPRTLRVGIGDDAAVWQPNRHHLEVVTSDMLVDGVHFRFDATSARALGHKALAKSLSDVAAMGAAPMLAVVALGVTPQIDEAWVREFYDGMAQLGASTRCAIAGGDIVRAPALTVAVTVVGDVRRTALRLRSGAKAGDSIAVSGPLGLGAAGLKLHDARSTAREGARAVASYLTPQPRLAEGKYFGSRRAVHAMMDLSDGLSTDLRRMASASAVDAVVDRAKLYVHPSLALSGAEPFDLILNGGDDYELLVAVETRAFPHVARSFQMRFGRPLTAIGRFEKGSGSVWLESDGQREPLTALGYDHLERMQR